MSGPWPRVRLGDVLRRSDETVPILLGADYREVTVKLWGKGAVLRGAVSGAGIAGSRRFVARTGQLILSRIDARNGALGIVPPELEGAVVTNDFPLFKPDLGKLEPGFLGWLSKTRDFVELCQRASEGTTNRVRLQEERFLALRMPLPPLAEQRRIVARIEELAGKVAEARSLRLQAVEEATALLEASVSRQFAELHNRPSKKLEMLATKIGSGSTPQGGRAAYPASGIPFIRSMNVRMRQFQWDDIVFISEDTHKRMSGTQVRPRDVLLNITGASIGRVACAPADLQEANVNQHVAIIRPTVELEARFLMYWLSQPAIQDFING